MAYVSVSRGRYDAQIYTNNAQALGQELGRDVSHPPAIQQEFQRVRAGSPLPANCGPSSESPWLTQPFIIMYIMPVSEHYSGH